MSSRLCGYCREVGHNAGKCERKQWQIDSILRHTAGERKAFHDLLLRNGIGLGAILRHREYGTADSREYVVTSMKDCVSDRFDALVEYRIHKYKKSTKATLRSWTGVNHITGEPDGYYVNRANVDRIYLTARPFDDMSSNVYLMMYVSRFDHKPEWASRVDISRYYSGEPAQILCPSSDTDMTDEDFLQPVRIAERLGKDQRGYGLMMKPYFPPVT